MRPKARFQMAIATLVLLAMVLAAVPLLGACGGDDDDEATPTTTATEPTSPGKVREIVIGSIVDFTGPTRSGQVPQYMGWRDYYRYVDEENPIPGIKFKVVDYDTKYDPGRTVTGYVSVIDKGAIAVHLVPAATAETLEDRFVSEQVPFVGTKSSSALLDSSYHFGISGLTEGEAEAALLWIADNWDYEGMGRVPKIGFVGLPGTSWSLDRKDTIKAMAEAQPDKWEYVGGYEVPPQTVTFASEVTKLTDVDYIMPALVGPQVPNFLKEAKSRGYEGDFITTGEVFMAYFDLMGGIPDEWLDGIMITVSKPLWNDPSPLIAECKKYTDEYLSGDDHADAMMKPITRIDGWLQGMVMAEAIRRAADSLGPENIDGKAIRDEIEKTNIVDPGFATPLMFTDSVHSLLNANMVKRYDAASGEWVTIGDWYVSSFVGDMYE